MDKVKKMLPFLLIMVVNFYLLPLFINGTGLAIVILLVVIPLICLTNAAFYGAKHGFCFLFCVLVTILFVPTIFIFYNSTAWIYVVIYGIVVIVGNAIGMLFGKRTK